jgi:hypothetical protein
MKIRLILAGFLVVGLAFLAKGEGTAMAASEIFRVAGREMNLATSLLGETNAVFDRAVWGAMGESRDADLEVHLRYEFDQKWSEVPGGRWVLHLK